MSHTSGPWTHYDDSEDGKTNRHEIVAMGKTICHIYLSVPQDDAANARLIAAAPDLLDALEKCPLPDTMGTAAEHFQRFYNWYQAVAVPAIQKAGGLA